MCFITASSIFECILPPGSLDNGQRYLRAYGPSVHDDTRVYRSVDYSTEPSNVIQSFFFPL